MSNHGCPATQRTILQKQSRPRSPPAHHLSFTSQRSLALAVSVSSVAQLLPSVTSRNIQYLDAPLMTDQSFKEASEPFFWDFLITKQVTFIGNPTLATLAQVMMSLLTSIFTLLSHTLTSSFMMPCPQGTLLLTQMQYKQTLLQLPSLEPP